MHYYPFNIGDYARRTQRLSLMEDLAYRRLLDLYYLDEHPFSDRTPKELAREIGMLDTWGDVEYVVNKFFPDGVNKGADKIITDYRKKHEQQKAAGIASGKARKLKASERTLNECSTNDEPTNNHKPITINHKPIKDKDTKAPAKLAPTKIVELYNQTFSGTQAVMKRATTPALMQRISVLTKTEFTTIDEWTKFFDRLKLSAFLMSEVPPNAGYRQFKLKLEWIVNPTNLAKIVDGHYHG